MPASNLSSWDFLVACPEANDRMLPVLADAAFACTQLCVPSTASTWDPVPSRPCLRTRCRLDVCDGSRMMERFLEQHGRAFVLLEETSTPSVAEPREAHVVPVHKASRVSLDGAADGRHLSGGPALVSPSLGGDSEAASADGTAGGADGARRDPAIAADASASNASTGFAFHAERQSSSDACEGDPAPSARSGQSASTCSS
jgi:hypothetical protein